MKKRLSSLSTPYHKTVFPAIWIIGFGLGTIMIWNESFTDIKGHVPAQDMKWTFLIAWVAGIVFNLWFSLRLKSVWLEDDHLIVKNFHEKETIPLWQIDGITETRLWRPKMIKIRLKQPSRWGEQIIFVAPFSMKLTLINHPVVIELRELASKAMRRPV